MGKWGVGLGRKEVIPITSWGWESRQKDTRLSLQDSAQQMITELPDTIPEAQCKCHFLQEAFLDVSVGSTPSIPLLSEHLIFQAQPCPYYANFISDSQHKEAEYLFD